MKTSKTPANIVSQNKIVSALQDYLPTYSNPPFWKQKPEGKDVIEYVKKLELEKIILFTLAQRHLELENLEQVRSVSNTEIEYEPNINSDT